MGLDSEILHGLIDKSLSKARSLSCLHLSGNPGISKDLIEFIRSRVKCKDPIKTVTIDFP